MHPPHWVLLIIFESQLSLVIIHHLPAYPTGLLALVTDKFASQKNFGLSFGIVSQFALDIFQELSIGVEIPSIPLHKRPGAKCLALRIKWESRSGLHTYPPLSLLP